MKEPSTPVVLGGSQVSGAVPLRAMRTSCLSDSGLVHVTHVGQ